MRNKYFIYFVITESILSYKNKKSECDILKYSRMISKEILMEQLGPAFPDGCRKRLPEKARTNCSVLIKLRKYFVYKGNAVVI